MVDVRFEMSDSEYSRAIPPKRSERGARISLVDPEILARVVEW
jgi:hypothetical protein